jgi:undecaprenyl diphosphate synthase
VSTKINQNKLPQHVAVIMDGNGRWAKEKGMFRIFGHQNGVKAVKETVEAAAEIGIKYLTLYAFSTENWNRPKNEVDALMELLVSTLASELPTLIKNNIQLKAIGNLDSLPKKCLIELKETMHKTQNNSHMTLILALSYSSKWEITQAIKNIATDCINGKLKKEEISEETLSGYLCTAEIPDPELMIRTSGELRISNFLLWQLAYAELYFTEKLWPDFRKDDFFAAILNYQQRERRFGKTGDQIAETK